jgi:hypothetical protein
MIKKFGLALLTFGVLGLSNEKEPIQDDRNEILVNWHNDQGEKKIFKIDDEEINNGKERVHSKTFLQKYSRLSCSPSATASDDLSSFIGSGSESGSGTILGGSSSCSSSTGSGYGSGNLGNYGGYSSGSGCCDSGSGNCYGSNYLGNDYGAGCATGGYGAGDYGAGCASGYGTGVGAGAGYGYGSADCGSGYGASCGVGDYNGYGNNSGYGAVAGAGVGAGSLYGAGAYGGQNAGYAGYNDNFRGAGISSEGILGTRAYNGNRYYDSASLANTNNLSYDQLCRLLNQERARKVDNQNARSFLRGSKGRFNNQKYDNKSQIDKICKENERDCLVDACNSAKIANNDIRNDKYSCDEDNLKENELKTNHNLLKSADVKNEHLNMNEKARDNLHSHKRIVCEFDKLEHFKKCCENCKDAEKGRRANVNKANNINKNQKSKEGKKTHDTRFSSNLNVNQNRDKNEFNYDAKDRNLYNKKIIRYRDSCASDNDYTKANTDSASCDSDDAKAYSNSCKDEASDVCDKKDAVLNYDANCANRNANDKYARRNILRQDRDQEYPILERGGCDDEICGDDYNTCDDEGCNQ